MRMRFLTFAITLSAVLSLLASTSLAGGRTRLHAIKGESSYSESDTRAEVDFGREVAARILARFPMIKDDKLNRYVGLVGTGLAAEGGRDDLEYKFAVIDTDIPNAFAAPGGYVFVTRGLISRIGDEAELSAVLAHEIAHISRRHIVRTLNIRSSGEDTIGGLARVIGGAGEVSRVAMGKLVDLAEEILFDKGYAVKDETEADGDAVTLVGAVGYDPGGLARYLARVDQGTRPEPASIKATHPAYAQRKSNIDAIMARDGLEAAKRPDMKERFNENVKIR